MSAQDQKCAEHDVQKCKVKDGTICAESGHNCAGCKKPIHAICGYKITSASGEAEEGYSARRQCSICHVAQQGASSPSNASTKPSNVLASAVPHGVSHFAHRQVREPGGILHYSYHYIPPLSATRPPHNLTLIAPAPPNYVRQVPKKKSANAIKQQKYRDNNKEIVRDRDRKRYLQRISESTKVGDKMRARSSGSRVNALPEEKLIFFNEAKPSESDPTGDEHKGASEGLLLSFKKHTPYNIYQWCHCWIPGAASDPDTDNMCHVTPHMEVLQSPPVRKLSSQPGKQVSKEATLCNKETCEVQEKDKDAQS